jgi:serine/threonine protein kinase
VGAPATDALRPGAVVDCFRIGEPIHAGGLGAVHAVTRVSGPDDGFPLVMKIPSLGPGQPPENVVTFEMERMILATLRGPHSPRFVAAGDLAAQPYLVMERIEGRSLAALEGPIAFAEVARIGSAVAEALAAVHLQDVIHLDVKPSNVILRGGEAVLIDFGLARHLHHPDLLGEESRSPIGSAPYVSPEQVLGLRSDPRSDLFSLGAMLYELATGELPFGFPTSLGGLRQRLWIDPEPPRARRPELPDWLQEVILRCLEPDPKARDATAGEVALALAHPERVTVTERGRRLRRAGARRRLVRWIEQLQFPSAPAPERAAGASVVLVAIATHHRNEKRNEAIRAELRREVASDPRTRLACVAVIRPAADPAEATTTRIRELLVLRHWTEPLNVPPGQVTHQVIESLDPVEALLDYARRNAVDRMIVGAPPADAPLGSVGTVAIRLMADAPCTVTIVRPRAP